MDVSQEELKLWAGLIYEYTGIVIPPEKAYLIRNRLIDMAHEHHCTSFKDLYFRIRYSNDPGLREQVISRISTQETSFFRDRNVFEALRSIITREMLPAKRSEAGSMRPPTLRIWSAACSTGQEPYSIAMILSESIPDVDNWDIKILATDIADNAFRKASLGQYTQLELRRGLPPSYLDKYFVPVANEVWQVSDRLRAMVAFQKINLVQDGFGQLGLFDLIFCRNVAIYFDIPTKMQLMMKLELALSSKGYLFVGATESASQVLPTFQAVHRYDAVFYRKTTPDLSSPPFTRPGLIVSNNR